MFDSEAKIRVIVPSYQGAKKLPALLEALNRQSFRKFEVIVVLDGSTDESESIIREAPKQFPVRVITQSNKGRSAARNAGVYMAAAPLLVFFDDDMRPDSYCLQAHWNFYCTHAQEFYIVSGVQKEEMSRMQTDVQRYKASLSEKWNQKQMKSEALLADHLFFTSANASLPRVVFQQLKGFDENLSDAEDFDLAIRAFKQQITVYTNPSALAWHDDFITLKSYILRQQAYAKAHQVLHTKHIDYQKFNTFVVSQPNEWKTLVYQWFCRYSVMNGLYQRKYIRFLPQKLRYICYQIHIHCFGTLWPHLFTKEMEALL